MQWKENKYNITAKIGSNLLVRKLTDIQKIRGMGAVAGMKNVFKRIFSVLLAISVVFLSCCRQRDKREERRERDENSEIVDLIDCEEYDEFIETIDYIIDSFSIDDIESDILQEFNEASSEKRSEIALELADDIVRANFLGIHSDEIFGIAGNIVKTYPHSALLNNFGIMALEHGYTDEALYLLLLAAAQCPDNPVLLVNVANLYLELGYYSEAKLYAEMALNAAGDFGPAYQILTTLHLKDGNSELAAETMIKSAKHCFNDISVYHFLSFLDAVSQLDPEEDDFPLDEKFIDELYEIARENTGSYTDVSTDIPEAQLSLKDFPPITGPENLMKSRDYLNSLFDEKYQKEIEINRYYQDYTWAYAYYLSMVESSYYPEEENVYEVLTTARQICAVHVLESYYRFELNKLNKKYENDIRELLDKMWDEADKIKDEFSRKQDELMERAYELNYQLYADLFSGIFTETDLGADEAKEIMRIVIDLANVEVQKQNAIMQKLKSYSYDIVNKCQEHYNKQKVLLEEFWLRYGGLLKYVEDFDVYMSLSEARERVVVEFYAIPLYSVDRMANILKNQDEILEKAKADLANRQSVLGSYISDPQTEKLPEQEDKTEEGLEGDPDFFPDIERQALTKFKEKSDLGWLGAELGDPILDLFECSLSWDGEKASFEFNSPLTSVKYEYDTSTGTSYTHVLYGVSLTGKSKWFTERDVVKKALEKIKVPGAVTKALGKIELTYSNKEGFYVVKNRANVITDMGKVHVREKGGSVFEIGKSKKITVNKSMINGVATKSETKKYKFIFATYEH